MFAVGPSRTFALLLLHSSASPPPISSIRSVSKLAARHDPAGKQADCDRLAKNQMDMGLSQNLPIHRPQSFRLCCTHLSPSSTCQSKDELAIAHLAPLGPSDTFNPSGIPRRVTPLSRQKSLPCSRDAASSMLSSLAETLTMVASRMRYC